MDFIDHILLPAGQQQLAMVSSHSLLSSSASNPGITSTVQTIARQLWNDFLVKDAEEDGARRPHEQETFGVVYPSDEERAKYGEVYEEDVVLTGPLFEQLPDAGVFARQLCVLEATPAEDQSEASKSFLHVLGVFSFILLPFARLTPNREASGARGRRTT
jgi:hypothetical protein